MARRSHCYKDVLPFTVMVSNECANVGLNVLFKAATSKGMRYYVFITFSYAISTLVLIPFPFFSKSSAVLPPLKFNLISKLFFIGLLGFIGQICGYKGIEYSSPTLASAVGNLSPAFTFVLALLFRMETVALRSSITQAKIIGTVVSISGALVVVLYKGPIVYSSSPWTSSSSYVLLQWPLESSPESNWVIGGVLLAVAYVLISLLIVLLKTVMEIYPEELTVAFLFNLCATSIAIPVSLVAESNLSSWRLTPSITLVAILYSGVISCLQSIVKIWGVHLKGPVYVAIFKPLSIAIAAFMSAIFLGDSLHLGSVIGAIILTMGFYAVIWGKAKEEDDDQRIYDELSGLNSFGHLSNESVPLLQSHEMERI